MDQKIEKAISKLLEIYEKIENDLLIEIAGHFSVKDGFYNSDYWRVKKLEELGLFNQDVIDYLKKATKRTDLEIKNALNQIGIDTINIDKLNRLFEDEVLKINPNILTNNYTINSIINTAYNELSNTLIQMSNKISKATREAYLNVVEETYLKVNMGTHSYQEAIRESINNLSNRGIKTLVYKTTDKNGNVLGIRNYDVEGAVRREVLTASRQLNNKISMEIVKELNCEYLYLSEHLQCRPNHFEWQGTIIKKKDLVKITHYGEIDGLAGINCRHYFEPYFGSAREDELKHFNKEECEKAYNLSQEQRYLERGIRKWKRKAEMFKANNDEKSYLKSRTKVDEWYSKINKYSNDNNLKRDFYREYVSKNKYYKNEERALKYYISPKSIALNEKLRNNIDLSNDEKDIVDNLDNALRKTPNYRGLIVRDLQLENVEEFMKDIQIGKQYSTNQYLSFSTGKIFNKNANVKIFIEKSKNAKNLVKINTIGENEVLYERNKKFKTLNIQEKDGIIYVLWEEMR